MIRLLFFLDTLELGGTELHAVRVAERLDRSRFDLSVVHVHADGPLLQRYRAIGVPMRHLPLGGRLASFGALRQAVQFQRLLRRERVQIFHSHDLYGNIFGVPVARAAGVPVVIGSRRWWDSVPRSMHRRANRWACRLATHVTANSPSVARKVVEEDGVLPARVLTTPNFVGEEAFAARPNAREALRSAFKLPPDALIIGMVARLVPVKSPETLVRAMAPLVAMFPSVHAVLIGEGPERRALEGLVRASGLGGHVHLGGATLPGLENLHAGFDISVLCSLSEGLPNSIVEAMAAGRPVVASAVGGIPDVVEHGVNGLLVAPRDLDGWVGALTCLIVDEEQRLRLGASGRALARAKYHEGPVMHQLMTIYESLVARVA